MNNISVDLVVLLLQYSDVFFFLSNVCGMGVCGCVWVCVGVCGCGYRLETLACHATWSAVIIT